MFIYSTLNTAYKKGLFTVLKFGILFAKLAEYLHEIEVFRIWGTVTYFDKVLNN